MEWFGRGAANYLILSFHSDPNHFNNLKAPSRPRHLWLVAIVLCHHYWTAHYPVVVHIQGKRRSKRVGKESAIRQISPLPESRWTLPAVQEANNQAQQQEIDDLKAQIAVLMKQVKKT